MATVTGTLADFGLESLAQFAPEITFTPSGPAVFAPYLMASKPISVIPAPDGTFSVDLFESFFGHPATWYTIKITWLNGANVPVGFDPIDWKLMVPEGGGALVDLLEVPSNPAQVWVGPPDPNDPSQPLGLTNPTSGTWWLNPNTGDIYEWSN